MVYNYSFTYTYSNAPNAGGYADGSFTKLKNGATTDPTSTNEAVGWKSTTAKYASIDLSSAVLVNSIILYPGEQFTGTNPYVPASYTISSSADGISYTSVTNGTMNNTVTIRVVNINVTARYWKIDWSGSASDWQMWREIRFDTSTPGWAKKIQGITPAKVNNVAVANISKVNGA